MPPTEVTEVAADAMDAPPMMMETTPEVEAEPELVEPDADAGKRKPAAATPARKAPTFGKSESAVRTAIKAGESKSLRDLIESFGLAGAYKVSLVRTQPTDFRVNGRLHKTEGFLWSAENATEVDEGWIQKHYGGGTYEVKFHDKSAGTGWKYAGQRTLKIAGDPIIEATEAPAGAAPTNGENPTIVKEAMGMMADVARRAEERADRPRSDGNDQVVAILRDQIAASSRTIDELRREMREVANKPAPVNTEDKFKDKYLEKLIDGDSARLQGVRMQYESELNAAKANAIENERRLRDSFDRDKTEMRLSHERELALVRQSRETEIASLRSSHEVQLAAAKASFELQTKLLEATNQRLDRDNTKLESEVRDLRAKKDKTPIEMAKDFKAIKDAFGSDDDAEPGGVGEKLLEAATNPEMWAGVSSLFKGAAPPAATTQAVAVTPKRHVVRHSDGKKYILEADGKTLTGPLPEKKPKGAPAEGSAPGEPQLPDVEPERMTQIVGFLERAFEGNQDAEVVAQGARSLVPEELLLAIRDHGVDVVLAKMAKLPSTSPLSTQAGRNWARKLGKALVGE